MEKYRKAARAPVTLKIRFKSDTLEQFVERYAVDVSRSGIFIRTKKPFTVGTKLHFEFQLQNSSLLIKGEGTVAWMREPEPKRPQVAPGMGVRFDELAPGGEEMLERILREKQERGRAAESRYDSGMKQVPEEAGDVPAEPVVPSPAASPTVEMTVVSPAPTAANPAVVETSLSTAATVLVDAPAPASVAPATAATVVVDAPAPASVASATAATIVVDAPVAQPPAATAATAVLPAPTAVAAAATAPAPTPAPPAAARSPTKTPSASPATARPRSGRSLTTILLVAGLLVTLLSVGLVLWVFVSESDDHPGAVHDAASLVPEHSIHARADMTSHAHHELPPDAGAPGEQEPSPDMQSADPVAVLSLLPSRAGVEVTTTPAGATVLIEDTPVAGVTPLRIPGLDLSRSYNVTISLPGHRPFRRRMWPGEPWRIRLMPERPVRGKSRRSATPAVVPASPSPLFDEPREHVPDVKRR